jgi:glutathione S-transferase
MKFVVNLALFISAFLSIAEQRNFEGTLYVKEGCFFCHKVFKKVFELDQRVKIVYVDDPQIRQELIEKGGKMQVPCFIHDDFVLYESDCIIDYLNHTKSIE